MLCAINRFLKICFWVPRDSGDLQNFLKNPKVSDLTPGRANIDFYTKISLVSEVSRYQGKIGQRPITKKMVLMVAKPNFLVLQPLAPVPFMRHHSEKNGEKHPLHNFKFTFSPFSCPMLPSYTVPPGSGSAFLHADPDPRGLL